MLARRGVSAFEGATGDCAWYIRALLLKGRFLLLVEAIVQRLLADVLHGVIENLVWKVLLHPLALEDINDAHSGLRDLLEHSLQNDFAGLSDLLPVVRAVVVDVAVTVLLQYHLVRGRFEGGLPDQQAIQNHAQAEHVPLLRVGLHDK